MREPFRDLNSNLNFQISLLRLTKASHITQRNVEVRSPEARQLEELAHQVPAAPSTREKGRTSNP
ncbi:MAG: hypothetical protein ACK5AZ_24905 [Bryobacteraceae bacterium]